jgi:WhiB family transcriptional regulator, redox-sensing transcriptional regulator
MKPRVIEIMAWHPQVPGSDRHADRIDAQTGAPDLSLINPDEWEWQDRGLCAEVGVRLFFPERGETAEDAKRVCAMCEVRAQCLDFAVSNGIADGVWGGLDEDERRLLGPMHYDFRPARGREDLAA